MPTKGIVSVCELKKKGEEICKLLLFFFIVFYAFITFASFSGQSGLQLKKHLCLKHQHILMKFILKKFIQM